MYIFVAEVDSHPPIVSQYGDLEWAIAKAKQHTQTGLPRRITIYSQGQGELLREVHSFTSITWGK